MVTLLGSQGWSLYNELGYNVLGYNELGYNELLFFFTKSPTFIKKALWKELDEDFSPNISQQTINWIC
jgi:hypothetical protein